MEATPNLAPTVVVRGFDAAHVSEDDRVRIRLGDRVFARHALRLPYGGFEYETARRAIEARYDIAVADRDPERTVWIYRLDPR